MIKKFRFILPLLLILLIALSLRLYKLDTPLADWHSFRQADTASVTREYYKHGINLLTPRYHDLSNIQSGKENPNGYRMVEFPIINGLTALLIQLFSLYKSEIIIGRLISILFSLITIISIYFLGLKLTSKTTAIVSSICFAILPFSVYYSRVILPEPGLLAFSTLSLLLFLTFLEKNKPIYLLFTLISYSTSLLIKPYAIFLFPVFISLYWFNHQKISKKTISLLFLSLCLIPLLLWRNWINNYPEGIPASDWLFNQANIRLKGAFFYWLFEIRLFTLILGITGVIPVFLGLIKKGKDNSVYLVWISSLFAYSIVFAGGNIQHDYYQIIYLPIICLFIGRGVDLLLKLTESFIDKILCYLSVFIVLIFSLFISWYHIRGYYSINHWEIVEAGQKVDELTPKGAKVIAPYNGDTAFLFQTNRTGWPIGYYIDEKIKLGATYYVSVNYDDETRALEKAYQTVFKNDRFIILDLLKKKLQ